MSSSGPSSILAAGWGPGAEPSPAAAATRLLHVHVWLSGKPAAGKGCLCRAVGARRLIGALGGERSSRTMSDLSRWGVRVKPPSLSEMGRNGTREKNIINIQNEKTCVYNLFNFPSKLWHLQFSYSNLNQLLLNTAFFISFFKIIQPQIDAELKS